ncbi:MAG: alpha-amylase [Bacteroides sp. SM23_62]|nr:MAG: alpha-amylase [Bacteroides sp. SM23_62]
MGKLLIVVAIIILSIVIAGCRKKISEQEKTAGTFISEVIHPEWSKSVTVYEVNVRQYTQEGTFRAFAEHLPRLKDLGVEVIWFMPIHPIGEKNRKGELGSYYSVKDYKATNPEFGTLDDFKDMLASAHEMGFYVLLDWVPNHTSWDNHLLSEHPEWYDKDENGEFIAPYDWTDVVKLDWSKQELRDYMLEALKFWVEMGVDGFRVDHPHETPKEFWELARTELDKIRPVLMLAENEEQTNFLERGFDMNYAWELHHMMNDVATGKTALKKLKRYFQKEDSIYPPNVYRMRFLTNHDENSWKGTITERLGDAHEVFAVFMFTMPGVPLLYSGQEACLDKRLEFFKHDPIEWHECDLTNFYQDLIQLKKDNIALWNGEFGGPMEMIKTSRNLKIFAFSREKDVNKVLTFLNLSSKAVKIKPEMHNLEGSFMNAFTGERVDVPFADSLRLEAWDYLVLVK